MVQLLCKIANDTKKHNPSLHSIMVQLLYKEIKLYRANLIFTFHYGSITMQLTFHGTIFTIFFTFHYGSITID